MILLFFKYRYSILRYIIFNNKNMPKDKIPLKLKKIVYWKNCHKYNLIYCCACECCKEFCVSLDLVEIKHTNYPPIITNKKSAHFDHIIPESLGGPTTEENLQIYCRDCNIKKGNMNDEDFRRLMDYMDREVDPQNELHYEETNIMSGIDRPGSIYCSGINKTSGEECRNRYNPETGYCHVHRC